MGISFGSGKPFPGEATFPETLLGQEWRFGVDDGEKRHFRQDGEIRHFPGGFGNRWGDSAAKPAHGRIRCRDWLPVSKTRRLDRGDPTRPDRLTRSPLNAYEYITAVPD